MTNCLYQYEILCPGNFCSTCPIFQEFIKRAERYSEQLRRYKDVYQVPLVSRN